MNSIWQIQISETPIWLVYWAKKSSIGIFMAFLDLTRPLNKVKAQDTLHILMTY